MNANSGRSPFQRIGPGQLAERLRASAAPMLLDARRRAAFDRNPSGIPGAVPVYLDDEPVQLPDIERSTPVVTYCVCDGQASSARVALWLRLAGYTDVTILDGGLPAWADAGLPVQALPTETRNRIAWTAAPRLRADAERPIAEHSWLAGVELPAKRHLTVLFVDMVDSTGLIEQLEVHAAFEAIQAFMQIVVEEGVAHCGDVRDFEGDGALLYFAGAGEALPAAFAIRERMESRRGADVQFPAARFALSSGQVIAGFVGNQVRRSLLLVGEPVHTAARLQKLAEAGQIVTTRQVLDAAGSSDPDLVARFQPLAETRRLKGFNHPVAVWGT